MKRLPRDVSLDWPIEQEALVGRPEALSVLNRQLR